MCQNVAMKVCLLLGVCQLYIASYLSLVDCQVVTEPEQVHLSYGDNPTQMVVTWVTLNATKAVSTVEYGIETFSYTANGSVKSFVAPGKTGRIIYNHKVVLTGLTPGQKYYYHCGSTEGWSDLFYFTAMKSGQSWAPRFAVYGDMGNKNAQSLSRLQEETIKGHFDAVLHVGDFAYDMYVDDSYIGDYFMKQIEPIAAYLPYMTCPGNHEEEPTINFTNYKYRFNMPGDEMKMFYRFDVGPVRFLSLNSEAYYEIMDIYGTDAIKEQYAWLDRELKEANDPKNRAIHPWVITLAHRPLYCSNSNDKQHCPSYNNKIRIGIPPHREYGLEEILYKYQVDLHITAHEHSFERIWPVYNLTNCNGSVKEPYTDPNSPIYIVTGSAGCQERTDPFIANTTYSAFFSSDYGYSRMTVHNATHLYFEQVSDDQDGKVIDHMWLIKTKRKPYTCHLNQN